MKGLIALLFVSMPAAAQAMGPHGAMGGMRGGYAGHGPIVLYALLAALGYWVLQHAAKETAKYVKRTGVTLGMVLVVVGLLGVLCGLANHVRMSSSRLCKCQEAGMAPGGEMKETMKDMPMMHEKMDRMKVPEVSKKTK